MNKLAKLMIPMLLSSFSVATLAQKPKNTLDVSVMYTTLHANAPVGGCGCFWMNGGSGELSVPIWRNFSAVGEINGETASQIPNFNVGLSLTSVLAGVRLRVPTRTVLQPYGQFMLGAVHGFNSYFPSQANQIPTSSDTSFATSVGGGIDLAISRHIWVRAIQADYHYSELRNLQGDRQNQFRIGAGLVFRFSGR